MLLASIPSPSVSEWSLGPLTLRAYAMCIVLGVVVAVWITMRRWRARGGDPGTVVDIAVWAVAFGLIGGRLYHVATDWYLYFGSEAPNEPIDALKIWNGGLGIWGAIALGGVGVWIACRRRGIALTAMADAIAPGLAIAQAIGRWGNYFNQELFGGPTDLPWGIEIEPGRPGTIPGVDVYHPTFLYESLWNLALAGVLFWAGSRYKLHYGRLFALYVAGYTLGRFWIEGMRSDPTSEILGLRLNQWTSIVLFLAALVYFWLMRNRTGEESLGVTPAVDGHGADLADEDELAGAAERRTQAETVESGAGEDDDKPGGDETSGKDAPGGTSAEAPAGAVTTAPAATTTTGTAATGTATTGTATTGTATTGTATTGTATTGTATKGATGSKSGDPADSSSDSGSGSD
ncbi:prolipoprotein diacylglyceryl transferase 1 [Sinosporangium siamense]|uniref:Phosphatidylglycerol--prolipoprotein diacylglyceryl transferase n=1 Tax=Sinosporangium siamense TaxID=1367973 RepID=A0A919RAK4_9ACTN|nr:prolipoprotein diacylglyceryl transferase [Sinosporangium siamense]GII90373.1 prolipoprotein diacylglyceryl transferase 1 [Sinosporangium siamense]